MPDKSSLNGGHERHSRTREGLTKSLFGASDRLYRLVSGSEVRASITVVSRFRRSSCFLRGRFRRLALSFATPSCRTFSEVRGMPCVVDPEHAPSGRSFLMALSELGVAKLSASLHRTLSQVRASIDVVWRFRMPRVSCCVESRSWASLRSAPAYAPAYEINARRLVCDGSNHGLAKRFADTRSITATATMVTTAGMTHGESNMPASGSSNFVVTGAMK